MNWIFDILKPKTQVKQIEDPNSNFEIPVVFIHGANQTSDCWNYIREKCNFSNEILVEYSSYHKFANNLDSIKSKIGNEPVFLVSHSLGGIYSVYLTQHCNVLGAVSISTPFRGSSAADWAKYIVPQYQLFKDVGRRSKTIIAANQIKISIPWKQIVTTRGRVPYLNGDNDGVVTVASMKHRTDIDYVEINRNHYDVLVSKETVDIILSTVKSVTEGN